MGREQHRRRLSPPLACGATRDYPAAVATVDRLVEPATDSRERAMFAELIRLPLVLWPIAWGFTGLGFYIAGFQGGPKDPHQDGPLWVALLFGMIAWGLAGSLTFHGKLLRSGMLTWGLTYAFAFGCGVLAARHASDDDNLWIGFAPYSAAARGTAVGPLAHVLLGPRRWTLADLLRFALGWAISSFAGALVGVLGLRIGTTLAAAAANSPATLLLLPPLGAALGATLGGLFTGTAAMIARDHRPRQPVG